MELNEIRQHPPPAAPPEPVELSEREREILILVAGGASNKEVAQRLVISPNTVKVHLRNIFSKIGVSSRTEAALYAVRAGLVHVALDSLPSTEAEAPPGPLAGAPTVSAASLPLAPAAPAPRARSRPVLGLAAILLLAIVAAVAVAPLLRPAPTPAPPSTATTAPPPTTVPRWQARTAMPTTRGRLAAVAYENQVYAIGGEADGGVTGRTERYDPATDTWITLTPMPVAVADVSAAVLGGLIYVPGGRLASGAVTDVVAVYDPIADVWDTRARLPVALSGYALAAFEGRLYLFGGWNGAGYVANVYEYDPAADAWIERTRMPTARGFAAAAASGGKLYVVGGTDSRGATNAIEAYVPARDLEVANPWQSLPHAPARLNVIAVTTIADTLYVTGRDKANAFFAWEFRPERESWQPLDVAQAGQFSPNWLSVVAVHTHLYILGSPAGGEAPAQLVAYQALYSNLIPVVTTGD